MDISIHTKAKIKKASVTYINSILGVKSLHCRMLPYVLGTTVPHFIEKCLETLYAITLNVMFSGVFFFF